MVFNCDGCVNPIHSFRTCPSCEEKLCDTCWKWHDDRCSAASADLETEVTAGNDPVMYYSEFLRMRGVVDPCPKCEGLGTYLYNHTGTWRRGGVVGRGFTMDVCDECWGTGDKHRKSLNLRKLTAALKG